MTDRLLGLALTSATLDIPLEDFDRLPGELGCSLHRRGDELILASHGGGCALIFKTTDGIASLESLKLNDDPNGHFLRDVVGLLFQVYSGDLDAQLSWSPANANDPRLVFHEGECTHPMFVQQLPPETIDRIEAALAEAAAAWGEYLRLRSATDRIQGHKADS